MLAGTPGHVTASIRCARLFRRPGSVLWSYISRKNPATREVALRNGVVLHLSGDDSDIVTVFLIFCRRDYGTVPRGASVIDVGANIGIFSIYAALSGARMVRSYEPAEESYSLLEKNVVSNGFAGVIVPHNSFVVGAPRPAALFPRKSSVFNQAGGAAAGSADDYHEVDATPFERCVADVPPPALVKMDCEGGEYDILLNSETASFDRVGEIRLEFHAGPLQKVMSRLAELGYVQVRFAHEDTDSGYLWVKKSGS